MRRGAALFLLLAVAAGQEDFARVKALIAQLGSADVEARAEAAKELGRLGPRAKSAVPALAKALGDEWAWVADNALAALSRSGPTPCPGWSRRSAARTSRCAREPCGSSTSRSPAT